MKKLHLGCGTDIKKDYINIDKKKYKDIDLVLDIGNEKFPFKDNTVDHVLAKNFIEHLDTKETNYLLEELYRICKPNANIHFEAPYFTSPDSCRPHHKQRISESYFVDYEILDPKICKSLDHKFYFKINSSIINDINGNPIVIFDMEIIK